MKQRALSRHCTDCSLGYVCESISVYIMHHHMQHLLISRIQWALLIHEMPMSLAARLEQKISSFICKWLYLHHSMSSLCFYSADSPCHLPVKSLTSVLKASKISGHLLLKHSHDPLVSSCPPKLKAGS